MMRYFDLIRFIKTHTARECEDYFFNICEDVVKGTTRRTYIFSHIVIKFPYTKRGKEQNQYEISEYTDGDIPMPFTRDYYTTDRIQVLIAEKVIPLIAPIGDSLKDHKAYVTFGREIESTYRESPLREKALEYAQLFRTDCDQWGVTVSGHVVCYDI